MYSKKSILFSRMGIDTVGHSDTWKQEKISIKCDV